MPTRMQPITDLSVVSLRREHKCEAGTLHEGATGSVVYTYPDGAGYEVEFEKPFDCVVTVGSDEIRLA